MAGYDVTSIEAFAYDFTKIVKGEGKGYCKGKGEIPEPSEEAIKAFIRGNAEDAVSVTGGSVNLQELLADPQKAVELSTKHIGNRGAVQKRIAKLCNNRPSEDELKELPYRHLRGFSNWLINEVSDPTASKSGIGL